MNENRLGQIYFVQTKIAFGIGELIDITSLTQLQINHLLGMDIRTLMEVLCILSFFSFY